MLRGSGTGSAARCLRRLSPLAITVGVCVSVGRGFLLDASRPSLRPNGPRSRVIGSAAAAPRRTGPRPCRDAHCRAPPTTTPSAVLVPVPSAESRSTADHRVGLFASILAARSLRLVSRLPTRRTRAPDSAAILTFGASVPFVTFRSHRLPAAQFAPSHPSIIFFGPSPVLPSLRFRFSLRIIRIVLVSNIETSPSPLFFR